ncbi:MAG: YhbY family RNA-binding protein [Gammaproteobacteria bacterium]|nr:YhbY family RNA-binding protein [Gammaproteobacteria bacterium]
MKQKMRELAAQVHKLKPVILIGNKGLTDAVQSEINAALEHHELIKIRIAGGDRDYREEIIRQVCASQQAILIKRIGHIFAIYRKKKDE